jgi:hypothetical protein
MNAIRSALEGFRKQGQGSGQGKVKLLADAQNLRAEDRLQGACDNGSLVDHFCYIGTPVTN